MASRRIFRKTCKKETVAHKTEQLESRVLLSAQIFVLNSVDGTIGEYTTSGSTVNASLVSLGLDAPAGVAVSGSDLFVTNSVANTVGEYTTSGATVNAGLISSSGLSGDAPQGIVVSGSDLFVVNESGTVNPGGAIGEYTTSGTTVNASLITAGLSNPEGLAISGSDLFVTNNTGGTIGEYTTSGATVNASLISGLGDGNLFGIAVSGSDLFVANINSGTIGEYTTSGATVNASLISGLGGPYGIAVSGSDLFVTNSNDNTVGEYTTSGATVNASLVSGLDQPQGIAVAAGGSAPELAFAQQPANTTTTSTLAPITVDIDDSNGNLLTSDNSSVTLALANNPTGATLNGTTTVAAVNGVATFSDLSIPTVGDGYTLTATDGSDTSATSTSFNISAPLPGDIFVTNGSPSGTIGEYTTSGATVNASLVSGLNHPAGIAVSGSDLFVVNQGNGTIGEYTTSGETVNASLVSGLINPNGIAVSGLDLFLTNGASSGTSSGTISEYTTSGATVNASLVSVSGFNSPDGIAVSGSDLFVASNSSTPSVSTTIGEYTTSGATVNAALVSGLGGPRGIAVSGSDLFQVNNNDTTAVIGEYSTSGATVNASLISGLANSRFLAVFGSDLFVAEDGSGTIGEYTTSGATVNASLVSGLTNPVGIAVTAAVSTPANLAFVQQPANTTTTGTLPPITVDVEDSSGNLLTGDNSNVTLAIANNPGGATLGGTTTVAAVNGVATFSDLSIPTVGDGYTLSAADGSDTPATSTSFDISSPLPSQLFVTNEGNNTIGAYSTSGATVNASLISGLGDPEGIAVSGSDLFVVNSGAGTVSEYTTSGALVSAALVSGLSRPQGIAVSGSDLFIVNFTSGTIGEYTTSGATVNASLISGLSDPQGIAIAGSDLFVTSPSSGTISEYTTSGATVNASLFSNELPGPTAIAVSGSDLFVTQTTDNSTIGTIGEYTTSGAIVNGSLVSGLIFPEGIALYGSDLFVVDNDSSAIGEYTTSGATVNAALASGLEAPFGIAVATIVPTPQLAFAQQPTNATTTTTLGPITVDVEDASGDLLTSDNSNVTLTIANNPTGATLGGTATVAAVNGVATFSDLSITTAGDNYALSATDGSDTAATSASFNIYPPPSKIGGLDPTFGVGGIASHDVGFSATNGVAQSGTQSVIIGTIGTSPEESFGITRYNADGSLDTAFGTNGVVTTSFAGTDDVPAAVDVLSSGEILVAGTAATFAGGQPVGSEFALAEYTADGALDPSFGVGGEVLFSFSSTAALSNDVLSDMAVSSTGIIYLAGSSDSAGTDNDFAIAAFNTDGSIDNGFGSGGHTLVEFAGEDAFLNAVALQSDGEIVAAGSATTAAGITSVALAGLLPTGILDPRFGTKGETITTVGNLDDEATSIAIQSDDKIVIGGLSASGSEAAGTLTSSFLVARYTSTGKIDRSFGGGPVVTPFGQPAAAVSVVIESDGDIIASGNTTASLATLVPSELDLALASYTTMGKLDPTFNGTGTAIISLSGNQPGASAVHSDALLMSPLDAGSDMAGLGLKFKGLEAKAKGVEQLPGGEISAVGNSGVDTVQAIIITSGSDLVALLTSGVPSAVVGGAKGSVSIRVVEDGSDFPLSSITIDLSVSQSSAGGGGPSFHSLSEKITLKPQKSKIFKLTFDYPSTLPNGNYYLLATVDTGTVQDLNLENNTAASNSAVEIAAAFIDLTGSNLTLSTFKTGKPAQVSFDIINNGNEPAKGVVSVEYLASVDKMQSDAITLMTVPGLSLNVKNASTKPAHQKLTIPTTLPAGTYYLLAVLDPANKLGDTDTSNNLLISSGQFTTT